MLSSSLFTIIASLSVLRVLSLGTEQISFHGLSKGWRGSTLVTMGICFWGATIVLWALAFAMNQVAWIQPTLWVGAIYAVAFGLYTAAFAIGPVGAVSPWTNLTVVLLWMVRPVGHSITLLGLFCFIIGTIVVMTEKANKAVFLMIASDFALVGARLLDVSNTQYPVFAYSASLFMSISLWMTVPILYFGVTSGMVSLARRRPAWSFAASGANGIAYLTLFALLRWLPAPLVEAMSVFASFAATFVGIWIFRESHGVRKVAGSLLMTSGVMIMLFDHYRSLAHT